MIDVIRNVLKKMHMLAFEGRLQFFCVEGEGEWEGEERGSLRHRRQDCMQTR